MTSQPGIGNHGTTNFQGVKFLYGLGCKYCDNCFVCKEPECRMPQHNISARMQAIYLTEQQAYKLLEEVSYDFISKIQC